VLLNHQRWISSTLGEKLVEWMVNN